MTTFNQKEFDGIKKAQASSWKHGCHVKAVLMRCDSLIAMVEELRQKITELEKERKRVKNNNDSDFDFEHPETMP